MTSSLVSDLRALATIVDEAADANVTVTLIDGSLLVEAADEIERLRAAGDALAKVWGCSPCEEFGENVHEDDNGNPIPCPAKTAYVAWKEARRG